MVNILIVQNKCFIKVVMNGNKLYNFIVSKVSYAWLQITLEVGQHSSFCIYAGVVINQVLLGEGPFMTCVVKL